MKVTQQGPTIAKVNVVDEHARERKKGIDLGNQRFQGKAITDREVVFHCLGFEAIYSTFAVHVNTGAPEQQFVSLQSSWKPDRHASPVFGPGATMRDGTRCGRTIDGNAKFAEREPSEEQWETYEDWFYSRFSADRVMGYCLRPPEMLGLTLQEYYEKAVCTAQELCYPNRGDVVAWIQERLSAWRDNGLYDMRLGRVYITPEFVQDTQLLRDLFMRRLGRTEAEVHALRRALCDLSQRLAWMDAIVV